MLEFGPPEHVFVENEWYDGPRAGVANVNGKPHRFVSQWDEERDDDLGTFLVWPIEPGELALETEQWEIFVRWNDQYAAGAAATDSHPGHRGTNQRWDEISALLATRRGSVSPDARRARARLMRLDREQCYTSSGPSYQLCWKLL